MYDSSTPFHKMACLEPRIIPGKSTRIFRVSRLFLDGQKTTQRHLHWLESGLIYQSYPSIPQSHYRLQPVDSRGRNRWNGCAHLGICAHGQLENTKYFQAYPSDN